MGDVIVSPRFRANLEAVAPIFTHDPVSFMAACDPLLAEAIRGCWLARYRHRPDYHEVWLSPTQYEAVSTDEALMAALRLAVTAFFPDTTDVALVCAPF